MPSQVSSRRRFRRSAAPFALFHLVPLLAFVTGVTWRAAILCFALYFIRMMAGLGDALGFDVDTPWRKLPAKARKAILEGSDQQVHVRYRNKYGRERSYYTGFEGVIQWVERRHADTESDWSRDKYEGFVPGSLIDRYA